MFPLFQYLTPAPAPANPTAAAGNAIHGIGQGIAKVQNERRMTDQENQFKDTLGFHQDELALRRSAQAHGEDEDAAGMVMRYNQFLASGDDASAQSLAPAMKQLGIDLVPRPGTPGMSPQDWQAQAGKTTRAEPDVITSAYNEPGELLDDNAPPRQAPKPAPKVNVPPLLSKFMTAAPKEALPAEAPPDEQAASAARVRSIGGTPQAPAQEAPISPGAAQVEAAATPDLSVGKPQSHPTYEVMYRGKSMGVIDPNLFHAQHKGEANRRGQAFVDSLPEAVANQFETGLNAAASGPEQKDAISNDMAILLQGMRSAASRGKGGVGAAADGILSNPKEASRLSTDFRTWVQAAATDNKVQELNKISIDAAKSISLLNPDEPLANRFAVAQSIKSFFGAAASEGERGFILAGKGELTKLEQSLNNWVNGAELPADYKASLQAIANRAQKLADDRASMVAEAIGEAFLDSPLAADRISPEDKQKLKKLAHATINAPSSGVTAPNKKPSVYSK